MSNVFDLSGRVLSENPKTELRFKSCPVCGDIEFNVVVGAKKILERLICADGYCDGYIDLRPVNKPVA